MRIDDHSRKRQREGALQDAHAFALRLGISCRDLNGATSAALAGAKLDELNYGRNMNAYVDCVTIIDDDMTRFPVALGELFHLELAD